jgi:hypothetical protein
VPPFSLLFSHFLITTSVLTVPTFSKIALVVSKKMMQGAVQGDICSHCWKKIRGFGASAEATTFARHKGDVGLVQSHLQLNMTCSKKKGVERKKKHDVLRRSHAADSKVRT